MQRFKNSLHIKILMISDTKLYASLLFKTENPKSLLKSKFTTLLGLFSSFFNTLFDANGGMNFKGFFFDLRYSSFNTLSDEIGGINSIRFFSYSRK